MNEPIYRLQRLSVAYHGKRVLEEVAMEIFPGEFWVFLGPNGSGKTTLVRTLLGLLDARGVTGEVFRSAKATRQVGFVPQESYLNPQLPTTVGEVVSLGFVGCQISRAEERARLAAALKEVDLHGLSDADYWSLSGGQRQRALIARMLVRVPQVAFLDEPTLNLDYPSERAFMACIARLHRERNLTVIFVTHDYDLALRYASHCAFVHGGRVVSGRHAQILEDPEVRLFFGIAVSGRREDV